MTQNHPYARLENDLLLDGEGDLAEELFPPNATETNTAFSHIANSNSNSQAVKGCKADDFVPSWFPNETAMQPNQQTQEERELLIFRDGGNEDQQPNENNNTNNNEGTFGRPSPISLNNHPIPNANLNHFMTNGGRESESNHLLNEFEFSSTPPPPSLSPPPPPPPNQPQLHTPIVHSYSTNDLLIEESQEGEEDQGEGSETESQSENSSESEGRRWRKKFKKRVSWPDLKLGKNLVKIHKIPKRKKKKRREEEEESPSALFWKKNSLLIISCVIFVLVVFLLVFLLLYFTRD